MDFAIKNGDFPLQTVSSPEGNSPQKITLHMDVSENSVPLKPMVLLIIIPIKWLFHWEYTQHFQTNPYMVMGCYGILSPYYHHIIYHHIIVSLGVYPIFTRGNHRHRGRGPHRDVAVVGGALELFGHVTEETWGRGAPGFDVDSHEDVQ